MSPNHPKPLLLPEEVRSLIARAREEMTALSPELEQRVEARVAATLGPGLGPGGAGPGSSAPPVDAPAGSSDLGTAGGTGAKAMVYISAAKAAAVVAIAVGIGGGATMLSRVVLAPRAAEVRTASQHISKAAPSGPGQGSALEPAAPLPSRQRASDPIGSSDSPEPASATASSGSKRLVPGRGRAVHRRREARETGAVLAVPVDPVAAPPGPAVQANSSLGAEQELLQKARSAVRLGQLDRANQAIAEHRRRFPRGQLVEEREALTVRVLAQSGDQPAARAAAERFRTRFPNSWLLPAVEEALHNGP